MEGRPTGRREGFRLIFARIEAFIKNSELTKRADRQTTFHQTMTYFWAHMIHYALEAARDPRAKTDFKFFLAFNPQLCNSGMFLHFYAKERMLNDPKARTEVVLPDRKPLPSLISSIEREGPLPPAHEHLPVGDSVSDSLFLQLFEGNRLPSWGHAAFIRLIYCRLKTQGRRKATDSLFASLKNLQKGAFHETKTYFWIQMVTHALATDFHACIFDSSSDKEEKAGPEMPEFEDLMQGKGGAGRFSYAASKLRELTVDTQFFHAFYSKKLIESKEAEESFVLPDKKPLPSFAAPR
uniref:Uncharacterized protein n=1 Tax=Chromera velia CCMP2878 TaxID=1169474 RepID=A0A0G4HB99_9ALVE|eukprot:Cvel_25887.t1-p1 / transcript=Cvel_25887.t1 / gene=Cvel_25887 / organism=Chromera_velia_CCMP2878 / gene_product=hypothetical protein / transcript_product=hypothetical protein / location=Cvel_scaffold2990:5565-6780(+) / protein_length=294 / sequence_SO=supercontig / SO=protein_coding / is_pseudo=false